MYCTCTTDTPYDSYEVVHIIKLADEHSVIKIVERWWLEHWSVFALYFDDTQRVGVAAARAPASDDHHEVLYAQYAALASDLKREFDTLVHVVDPLLLNVRDHQRHNAPVQHQLSRHLQRVRHRDDHTARPVSCDKLRRAPRRRHHTDRASVAPQRRFHSRDRCKRPG